MFIFSFSGHSIPEVVTVRIAKQGETLLQWPFEYFDDESTLPENMSRRDVSGIFNRDNDSMGSLFTASEAARGSSSVYGSGSGGNYGNQGIKSSLCLIHVYHFY